MHRRASFAALVVALALAVPATAAPARPRLLVIVTVDQMRADYFARYGGAWKQGLARLYREGAVFEAARYPYLNTVTCAGHATIGTGAFPDRHGMVLNGWWSHEQRRTVSCTEDAASPVLRFEPAPGAEPAGHSARFLAAPTLATVMREGLRPAPRVASFSAKPRSAITVVGPAADLVVFNEDGWSTARAFAAAPEPVIQKVLARHPVERLLGKPWDKVGPAAAYQLVDDDPVERVPLPFWSRLFPHPVALPPGLPNAAALSPLAAWSRSPLPDELLAAFARAAVTDLGLGRGPGTDLLAVSFSALDVVGHAFGPRSHEIQDVLLRLDRLLAELIVTLDARVGRSHYVLALSSDHGVADYPEHRAAEGKDGGRVPLAVLRRTLDAAIAAELGPGAHVAAVLYTDLYLAPGVRDRLAARPGAVDRVKAALARVPGVAATFFTSELRMPTSDPVQRAAALSHYVGRSGDFVLAPREGWLTTSTGTTHGTHHAYDQSVPLVLFGAGIKRGRYPGGSSPADIAPTLAHLVGLTLPRAQGRVLAEALRALPPK